ncbi:hypothetical protein ABZU76_14565 [Amycolatopsis sp. NPDC005232]|uniref:hypothetical protein n=1 Tax=Amycolatopsis sp. NPDC005232 TaxID=3157027 RepID=UPI0033AE58B4
MWTLLTVLRGFEERILDRRPEGTEFSYQFAGDNWLDTRMRQVEFADREPEVLILDAEQAGLSLDAWRAGSASRNSSPMPTSGDIDLVTESIPSPLPARS